MRRSATRHRWSRAAAALLVSVFAAAFATVARAEPAADFYRGRQLTLLIGAATGGGYDLQGRLVARHLGRKLPGNPSIVVQNMPGAGSITAANHLYNVAAKDGSVLALLQREILTASVLSPQNVRFDMAKFAWVGSIASETGIVVAWHTAPLKSVADLFRSEMIVGGTGPMIDTETTPRLLNALIGTRFRIVSGYPGTNDVLLAMERGEVMGLADWSWSNIKTRNVELLKQSKIRLLMQVALTKDADLPLLPFALDYVHSTDDRRLIEYLIAPKAVARPIAVPPGVPADRLQLLREAFIALKSDPEFLADAERSRLEVGLTLGSEVGRVIALIGETPKAQIDRLLTLIAQR